MEGERIVRSTLLALVPVAALGACAGLRGAPPAVAGRVIDEASEEPVAHALVLVDNGEQTRTNGRGEYRFPELDPGEYRVLVIVPGCRSAESVLRRPGPGPAEQDLRIELPPVRRLPGEVPPPDGSRGRVVTAEEIEELGAVRVSDVLRRVAPEMVGPESGAPGQPAALRGRGSPTAAGERIPVLVVDGVVVHATSTSDLDAVPARDVAWIEILSGAVAGWDYGTAGAGGVVRVRTKQGYRPSRDLAAEHCPRPEGWGG